MHHEPDPAPVYATFFGKAWTALSIAIGLVLFGMFLFGPELMPAGGSLWALLRWIFSPLI
jgi:hypothetical protein